MSDQTDYQALEQYLSDEKLVLVSNCCGANEYNREIDKHNTGRCGKCGDGAGFISENEFYNQ